MYYLTPLHIFNRSSFKGHLRSTEYSINRYVIINTAEVYISLKEDYLILARRTREPLLVSTEILLYTMQGSVIFHLPVHPCPHYMTTSGIKVLMRCIFTFYILNHRHYPLFENCDTIASNLFFRCVLSCIGLTSGHYWWHFLQTMYKLSVFSRPYLQQWGVYSTVLSLDDICLALAKSTRLQSIPYQSSYFH